MEMTFHRRFAPNNNIRANPLASKAASATWSQAINISLFLLLLVLNAFMYALAEPFSIQLDHNHIDDQGNNGQPGPHLFPAFKSADSRAKSGVHAQEDIGDGRAKPVVGAERR